QLHGHTDADSGPIYSRDDGFQGLEDFQRKTASAVSHTLIAPIDLVDRSRIALRPIGARRRIEGSGAGGEVGACAKGATSPCDDNGTNLIVLIGLSKRIDHLRHHRPGKGIELV